MKVAFDRLAKDALSESLVDVSRELESEQESAPDPQRIDLWCVPDPQRVERLAPLGVLMRIAGEGPCAFEFFHQAPDRPRPFRL